MGMIRIIFRYFGPPPPATHPHVPRDPEALVDVIRRMHEALFAEAEPSFAGRFRLAGEEVRFGGDTSLRHELRGEAPSSIHARLIGLLPVLRLDAMRDMPREELAHTLAMFLEDFFRIHPFVDGNGRIGRLFLEWLVFHESGRYRLRSLGHTRAYRKALQYAHMHAPRSERSR